MSVCDCIAWCSLGVSIVRSRGRSLGGSFVIYVCLLELGI